MTLASRNCFICAKTLEGDGDYHRACSRNFFGTLLPPTLDYRLDEMDELAAKVIRRHATVTGVQPKISLGWETKPPRGQKAGRLTLVGLWGRFILKPPTQTYPDMPQLEFATMRLAEAAGIPTVPHALIKLRSGELAYITRRIDRKGEGKLAMEDMCQLSGRLTEDKYKGSLERVGKIIHQFSTQPGLDAVEFFNRVLFCFLTGNADMHLKNFSLWSPLPGAIQLTPAYDMLATALLIPEDKEETALALDGKKKNLRRKNFDSLALSLGIPDKARDNSYAQLAKTKFQGPALLSACPLSDNLRSEYAALVAARHIRLGL